MQAISTARFHNVKPRTRAERQGGRDKEGLEKIRLKDRTGGYHKYSPFLGIANSDYKSSYFISETDRFNQDFAAEDKQRREQDAKRKQEALNRHREQIVQRDLNRWKVLDTQFKNEEAKLAFKQSRLKGNSSPISAANSITLEYGNSHQAEYLKKVEQDTVHRMNLRMQNIDSRMNSGYNILTGTIRRNSPNILRP